MERISYRVSQTKLFKEKDELGISFCWETADRVVFEKSESSEEDIFLNEYYLLEFFKTGEILVTDKSGVTIDKTDRILNLFRLNI